MPPPSSSTIPSLSHSFGAKPPPPDSASHAPPLIEEPADADLPSSDIVPVSEGDVEGEGVRNTEDVTEDPAVVLPDNTLDSQDNETVAPEVEGAATEKVATEVAPEDAPNNVLTLGQESGRAEDDSSLPPSTSTLGLNSEVIPDLVQDDVDASPEYVSPEPESTEVANPVLDGSEIVNGNEESQTPKETPASQSISLSTESASLSDPHAMLSLQQIHARRNGVNSGTQHLDLKTDAKYGIQRKDSKVAGVVTDAELNEEYNLSRQEEAKRRGNDKMRMMRALNSRLSSHRKVGVGSNRPIHRKPSNVVRNSAAFR